MHLEQQVCSLESAKRLKELGVKQDSYFWWAALKRGDIVIWDMENKKLADGNNLSKEHAICSVFIVAELGIFMKGYGMPDFQDDEWVASFEVRVDEIRWVKGDTEAEARAKMLIYLIEQGLLKDFK